MTAGNAICRGRDPADYNSAHVESGSDDSYVYSQAAKLLIDTHGADARTRAIARSRELMAAGDIVGHAMWQKVLRAMEAQLGRRLAKGRVSHGE
jgi:hypothetical protein